jgi:hypothetical protein
MIRNRRKEHRQNPRCIPKLLKIKQTLANINARYALLNYENYDNTRYSCILLLKHFPPIHNKALIPYGNLNFSDQPDLFL